MENQYIGLSGWVQKFGEKPAIETRDINGQAARKFVIKTTSGQKLVTITLFPEWENVQVDENSFIEAEGKLTVSNGNNGVQYLGVTPKKLKVTQGEARVQREVVNQAQPAASTGGNAAPF